MNTISEVKENKIRYVDKTWLINKLGNLPQSSEKKEFLKHELKVSDLLATFLLNRNIDTPEKAKVFLYGTTNDLHSPFLLKGMKKAVERTAQAIRNNEKIGFFTDFDADGTTSNALFGLAFKNVLNYNNIVLYIPHREKEGYGLNCPALKKLQDDGCSLVISADIGITAYKEANYCKEIGLDLIITDHHLPKLPDNYNKMDENQEQYLPNAYSLINPNRPDCTYPFKGICGCGVAYKFLCALWMELGRDVNELEFLIPIVTVATIADIVPLIDENRIIVKKGLEMMSRPEKTGIIGLDALIEVTGYKSIDSEAVSFGLAPRINSCGRLEHAILASELLCADDAVFALERAKEINTLNETRKEYQKIVIEKSYEQINQEYLDNNTAICFYVPDAHVGVVGIAAGQLTEKLYRPSIIVTDHPEHEGYVVGSARSIKSIHILNVLMECKDAFDINDDKERFGGHAQAAGLTIKKERFSLLQQKIKEYFDLNPVSPKDLIPKLLMDKAVRLHDVNGALMEDIDFLAPYGEGNPKIYLGLKQIDCSKIRFYKNETLGIVIPADRNRDYKAIGFKMHDKAKDLGLEENVAATLDIAFQPSWNEYQGNRNIQLMLEDIRRS